MGTLPNLLDWRSNSTKSIMKMSSAHTARVAAIATKKSLEI